ncbi:MAG TPA: hypothetical protein VHU89_18090 [Acidobacteriaceae bacterium]|jgi:hypothetical protein|nr:hypothetical protein [Acidobacteriaceae bacterium]
MRTISRFCFPVLLVACGVVHAQLPSPDAPPTSSVGAGAPTQDPSAAKARAVLDAMVQALGGERWLNLQNRYLEGRIAAFYQGKPTGATVRYFQWDTPAAERIDLTEGKKDKHNWTQVFENGQCWEITFRGKNPIAKDICATATRGLDHSIQEAVRVWMKDPSTILMYDGQSLAGSHLADQVTLLNAENDAITIQVGADTHLPLSRSWSWRDPVYKDKNTDSEEYADYHPIDGLPTPFTITRTHNGEDTQQRFIFKAAYNVALPPNGFDADAIAARWDRK